MTTSTVRKIHRRKRRVYKLRKLKSQLESTKDLKDREKIIERLQKISYYPLKDLK